MQPKPKVVQSINDAGAARCVDVFARADGSFGFEEYRRDVEDQRGWYAIGFHAARTFATAAEALAAARLAVAWLADAATG